MDFEALCKIGITAAQSAGRIIQGYMKEDVTIEQKLGGASYASKVLTVVDTACEAEIRSHILPTCETYDLAILSEETEDDGGRFQKDFFWCIDPMDGTLPFVKKRPGFSVSIALVAKDGTPHIGIVFDPITNTTYHAIKGLGAFRNGDPWHIEKANAHLTYVTDRKLVDTPRHEEIEILLGEMAETLGLTETRTIDGGGSVMNAIWVLENTPACLLKLPKKERGGGSMWDFAATACIYGEFGLPATNFAGGKLDLNRKDGIFMNHEGVFFSSFIA